MTLLEIIIVAVCLSMDTFAVAITLGLSAGKLRVRQVLIPACYFGFFQAVMPLLGYFAGVNFASRIQSFDHWIAFALLGFIGGKMIKDSFTKDKVDAISFRFHSMLLLAIATSVDALAIGITFAFLEVGIFKAVVIIGTVTFCITAVGVKIGNVYGAKFRSKAEFLGGAVLIILGVKILIEHLFHF